MFKAKVEQTFNHYDFTTLLEPFMASADSFALAVKS